MVWSEPCYLLPNLVYFFGLTSSYSTQHTPSTEIDSDISRAIRVEKYIHVENYFFWQQSRNNNNCREKSSFKRNTIGIWPEYDYFKQQSFGIERENFRENSIFYLNQGYQSVKVNKKIYYADHFLIGQVNKCLNLPEDLKNYKCEDREVKMYGSCYDSATGTLRGLYETLGYIMVRGDSQEHLLEYSYSKQNSKILHSYYKKCIPISFSGTFFNHHRIQFELEAFQTTFQTCIISCQVQWKGSKI